MAEPAVPPPSLSVDGDEVRVKTGGRIRDYVSYVIDRLQVRFQDPSLGSAETRASRRAPPARPPDSTTPTVPSRPHARTNRETVLQSETGASTSRVVTITATGRAVPKAVAVAEIAKRAHGGALHQVTTIDSIDSIESSRTADGARRRESHESRVTSHTEKKLTAAAPNANGATTPNRRRVTVIGVALSRDVGALGAGKKNAPGYQFSPESPADVGELKTSHRRRREAREEARSNASAGRRVGDETDGSTGERKDDAPRRRRARRGRGGGANRKKADELLEAEA